LADTPEESNHTSIQKRINAAKSNRQPAQLLPFAGNPCNKMPDGLPFQLKDYIELVELSGRHIQPNKKGIIEDSASPILTRVGLANNDWNEMVTGIETNFKSTVSFEKFIRQHRKYADCA